MFRELDSVHHEVSVCALLLSSIQLFATTGQGFSMCACSGCVHLFAIPLALAHQAPLSMEFSR